MTADNNAITVDPTGLDLRLVRIPSGSFLMGSPPDEVGSRDNERPAHQVHVQSFSLGVYPITQRQWLSLMTDLPPIAPEFIGDDLPVVNVWLEAAYEFCHALSRHLHLPFRLPSEAEWEYACRAGTTTPFYWGDSITNEQVNFKDESQPVGIKPAGFSGISNAFGLFDMHGNVWEWCSDAWHDDYTGAPSDGSAWVPGADASYQVQRGGSWVDPAVVCRSAFRVGDVARNTDNIVGIRVCSNLVTNFDGR